MYLVYIYSSVTLPAKDLVALFQSLHFPIREQYYTYNDLSLMNGNMARRYNVFIWSCKTFLNFKRYY